MTDTRTATAASLLHLVDRAERGSLLAEEAQQLRAGIRALGGRGREMEELRADLDRVQQKACRAAESLRTAEAERDAARERLDFLDRSRMPDMRRRTASDAETIKRWRKRAEHAEAAIERARGLATRLEEFAEDALKNDDRQLYAAIASDLRAALDQPQQPTEDEARQMPCSLWLLSNGHVPHRWQPQPGMADVLCPGAPRKAVATQ
jgi:hypothetical protein